MTKVLFRADKAGEFKGSVTAVFVDELFTRYGTDRVCYAHIGQHGRCSIDWIIKETRPAKPSEYRSLLNELKNVIGYDDLKIVNTARSLKRPTEGLINECPSLKRSPH